MLDLLGVLYDVLTTISVAAALLTTGAVTLRAGLREVEWVEGSPVSGLWLCWAGMLVLLSGVVYVIYALTGVMIL